MRSGVNTLSDDTDYSSAEEDEPSPPEEPSLHDSFVFGYRSSNLDLSSFHPSPAHLLRLWQIYQNNVEPTLKIIHVPTIDKLFRALSSGSSVSPRDEALVFSIYYAAIVSLEDDEVSPSFPACPRLATNPVPSAKRNSPPPRRPSSPATASPSSRGWQRPTS